MKLQKGSVPRLATIGLGAVTLCLASFALWSAVTISSSVDRANGDEILHRAYDRARFAVAEEDFLLTEYLLRLLPEEAHLDGAKLRTEHAQAAATLRAALVTAAAAGPEEARRLDQEVLNLNDHRDYLAAAHSLFDAVDRGDAEEALEIETLRIDPSFERLEHAIMEASARQDAQALQSLDSLEQTEDIVLVATPIVFAVGLLLLGVFWRVLRAHGRRVEEAKQVELERLLELDKLKDSFVASVSHELRTPLTSIQGFLELVLEGEAGELTVDQQRFLTIVDRNAGRLLRVVGDLLFVAQVDAGKLALERAPVDLAALAADCVEAARPFALEKGVALSLSAESGPELSGDAARLGQVLDNLVSNALKFTPPGGSVEMRTSASDGRAVLEVADTGSGIPPSDLERLFERFFRSASANEQAIEGTGLGLGITKAIVEAHGGTIVVESEEGTGTTFRVELPLAGRADAKTPLEPMEVA